MNVTEPSDARLAPIAQTMIRQRLTAARRENLHQFVWGAFDVLHDGGTSYIDNWHVRAMTHRLQRCVSLESRFLLITLPPRYLKTICASIATPAFILGHNPHAKVIITTYAADLSNQIMLGLRRLIASRYYQELFPQVQIRVSGPDLLTPQTGGIRVTSIGGSVTGFGADYIIIDDPMKALDATSEAERQRVRDYISGSLLSRFNNKARGCLIAIQQRLHEEDAAAHLLSLGCFEHLNLPAIAVEDEIVMIGDGTVHQRRVGDVLFPQNESRETLDMYRRAMGSQVFELQYQQNPVSDGGGQLDWSIFKTYHEELHREDFRLVVQSWDTAWSEELTADYSAGTTWGYREEGWYLLDVIRERLSYNALKHCILRERNRWNPDHILIERAGSGVSLLKELNREEGLRRGQLYGMRPRVEKEIRFASAVSRIMDGAFWLPAEARWLADFRRECLSFPTGKHDDMVDSMTQFMDFLGERRAQARQRGEGRPRGTVPNTRARR